MGEADALERRHGGLSRLLLGLLLQLDGCEREVAEHRHIGIQVELLEHHGAVRAGHLQVVLLGKRRAVDDDLATSGLLEIVHTADERRLTGAGRADDDDLLPFFDREVDVLQDVKVAEIFVQAADFDQICHAFPPRYM